MKVNDSPTGSGLNLFVYTLAIDSSGRIVVGGSFTSYNGTSVPHIARLNVNGSLDTSFAPTGSGFNSPVKALALDSSGKIVVGGLFTSYNGTSESYLSRLNTDGSLDTSFAPPGSGLKGSVTALSIDSSGELLFGGAFSAFDQTTTLSFGTLSLY